MKNLAELTEGLTDNPGEPDIQVILEKIRVTIKEIRWLVNCCNTPKPDRIQKLDAEPNGARLLDPEYRSGYARGYADAVTALAECCEDVVTGVRTQEEMRAFIASCCEEVGELLDQTALPYDMGEASAPNG